MARITPMSWQDLTRVFEKAGFHLQRIRGDHMAYTKPGILRPVIIPKHREISVGLIESNLRTAAISHEQFLQLAGLTRRNGRRPTDYCVVGCHWGIRLIKWRHGITIPPQTGIAEASRDRH